MAYAPPGAMDISKVSKADIHKKKAHKVGLIKWMGNMRRAAGKCKPLKQFLKKIGLNGQRHQQHGNARGI